MPYVMPHVMPHAAPRWNPPIAQAILIVLLLLMFVFAIAGCTLFGANDPTTQGPQVRASCLI